MNIVSSAKMSEKHQQRLRREFPEHQFSFYASMEEVPLPTREETEVLITYGEDVDQSLLQTMRQLKWIQVMSAGLDLMPFSAIAEKGILVTNASGIHRIPMAEYTLGMMLQLARNHYLFYDQQKRGVWDRKQRVDEIYGKTLGIAGYGEIGDEIAKRAHAFGMRILALKKHPSTPPAYVDEILTLEEKDRLFKESDYLVVVLPHTEETTNFIGMRELQLMKPSATLINIGRGKVIEEQALLQALQSKQIARAVLDVFVQEPLPEDHPFWTLDNLILTPHVSGHSPLYMTRAVDIFEQNLKHYPNEEQMINVIDVKRGY